MKNTFIATALLLLFAATGSFAHSFKLINNSSCTVQGHLAARNGSGVSGACTSCNDLVVPYTVTAGNNLYYADISVPSWGGPCTTTDDIPGSSWDYCHVIIGICTIDVGVACGPWSMVSSGTIYCCTPTGNLVTWVDDGFGNITVTIYP